VEEWPLCDCLISFFSGKFPLEKAEAYVALRKPFCLTNMTSEWVFQDRRLVYEVREARKCVSRVSVLCVCVSVRVCQA
jgi:inositol hexakisphosphate/diphosphoinositol-pentakisphosphate kinase